MPSFILAAFTGLSDEETHGKAIAMGFTQFVYKPAVREQLRPVLNLAVAFASNS